MNSHVRLVKLARGVRSLTCVPLMFKGLKGASNAASRLNFLRVADRHLNINHIRKIVIPQHCLCRFRVGANWCFTVPVQWPAVLTHLKVVIALSSVCLHPLDRRFLSRRQMPNSRKRDRLSSPPRRTTADCTLASGVCVLVSVGFLALLGFVVGSDSTRSPRLTADFQVLQPLERRQVADLRAVDVQDFKRRQPRQRRQVADLRAADVQESKIVIAKSVGR